jgi:DnaK suppressor protein
VTIMEDIKTKLLEMQSNILSEIEADRNQSNSAITDDIGDDIDHANEERYRELYQLMCERDQKKLEQIKRALDRIDEEAYGYCEECEEIINKARLIALPFTRLCINCKTEEERLTGI